MPKLRALDVKTEHGTGVGRRRGVHWHVGARSCSGSRVRESEEKSWNHLNGIP